MNILQTIVAHKKIEVAQLMNSPLLKKEISVHESISLIDAIRQSNEMAIIAEIKKGSPSKGCFAPDLDIISQAKYYQENGASCISVLTDKHFFYGSPDYLSTVRKHTKLPLLFKDFIINEIQIKQAKDLGADVILLIKRILTRDRFKALLDYAHNLKLEVLVEVHSKSEFDEISDLDFKLCGINNRSLKDFSIDLDKSKKLAGHIKAHNKLLITESGIHTKDDLLGLRPYIDGALIGESLVNDPKLLKTLTIRKLPVKVKICGLTDAHTAEFCDNKKVDYIGLVFAKSKRQVTMAQAKDIIKNVGYSKIVGVFKNQSIDFIHQVYKDLNLDYVQLHGQINENELTIDSKKIIKAFSYDDIKKTQAANVLIDGHSPGSGQTYPISKIDNKCKTVFLAGGLNHDNVRDRLLISGADVVDLSSSVETNHKKDIHKIKEFIETTGGI
ncbi:hypothetical protein EZV73_20535 [Acidaminobacter sp. JC074]|uniref:phosphoribosylanthranilate isomerase n=1 Tax=Acidaminobacter sp. JC074 TaxID=2530199 RepID=UPI001F113835|nr:hypothetical protein [Acidaminobacter sp. JC074]MCH4889978.1 hypothetical protein [Acidaminobacter sp. JC074]